MSRVVVAKLRVPGYASVFEQMDLRSDTPSWYVNAPPPRLGQGDEWWRAKRGVELLVRVDPTFAERVFWIYGPRLQRRWEVMVHDAIPDWAAEMPELDEWQGQQWVRDRRKGTVTCRRHYPPMQANEYWFLGPAGPERVPPDT